MSAVKAMNLKQEEAVIDEIFGSSVETVGDFWLG